MPKAKYLGGNQRANAAIKSHKIATSSSNWPTKLSVAWKYADVSPTTRRRPHIK